MTSKQKNAERNERRQQKLDAGLMSARYPGVASIVISMDYYRRGLPASFLRRTVNFLPGSSAYFLMECMEDTCIDGGFNLEPVISAMVNNLRRSAHGELTCHGSVAPGHRRIDYAVVIDYNKR